MSDFVVTVTKLHNSARRRRPAYRPSRTRWHDHSNRPLYLVSIDTSKALYVASVYHPNDSGCESACRLPESSPTITIHYYYSARKLILIYRPAEKGRRLSRPSWLVSCQDGLLAHRRSPISMLCISAACAVVRCLDGWLGVRHVRVLCRND